MARGLTDHTEQPIDQNEPATNLSNVPMEVISVASSEEDKDSSGVDQSSEEGEDTSTSATSSSDSSDSEPPPFEESHDRAMIA